MSSDKTPRKVSLDLVPFAPLQTIRPGDPIPESAKIDVTDLLEWDRSRFQDGEAGALNYMRTYGCSVDLEYEEFGSIDTYEGIVVSEGGFKKVFMSGDPEADWVAMNEWRLAEGIEGIGVKSSVDDFCADIWSWKVIEDERVQFRLVRVPINFRYRARKVYKKARFHLMMAKYRVIGNLRRAYCRITGRPRRR